MKTLLRGLVFMFALAGLTRPAFAQVTLTAADVDAKLAVGNDITTVSDTLTTSVNIGSPGATSWDFSGLLNHTSTTMTSMAPSSTPYIPQFPGATHALKSSLAGSFSGIPGTVAGDLYTYVTLGANLVNRGSMGSGTITLPGANPLPGALSIMNAPPDTTYALPSTMGTRWGSTYTTTTIVTIAGLEFSRSDKSYITSYVVDAYGPMSMPGGSVHQALRIRKEDRSGGTIVSYIFLAKDGSTVQVTASDPLSPDNGTISVARKYVTWSISRTTPPTAPTNLTAKAGDRQVTLQWSKNTEIDFWRYRIYRSTSPEARTMVDSSTASALDTTHVLTGLANGTKYYFRITAVNTAGQESWYSAEVNATPQGLVAYYPFSGNANDESGNGNNGAVTGAVLTTDRFGVANRAYSFDGNGDYINCGNAASLALPASASITVWIYAKSFDTDQGIISKVNGTSVEDWALVTNGSASVSNKSASRFTRIRMCGWGPSLSSQPITLDQWHFIAAVSNSQTTMQSIYIDNVLTDSSAGGNTPAISSANMYIGSIRPTIETYWSWNGKLDDIRIYNRALSAREIDSIYRFEGTPLPITLASFQASGIDAHSVCLTWSTISEIDNYGFEVERAAQTSGPFQKISTLIPGHGTTNVSQQYSFVDNSPLNGTGYYRLKQMDLDQSVHYSEAIEVRMEGIARADGPKLFALSQNYPNPFNPTTTIRYELPHASRVSLKVYNTLGQEVATLVNETKAAGVYTVEFDAAGLSTGVYFCRLEAGSFVQTRKLVLLR